jgi:glutamate-1-semialdehyde 2,1-aminomutase
MPLTSALEKAQAAYAARNPNSLAAYEKAVAVLPGGGTRTTLACDPFPLYIAEGSEGTLTDVDGHVYMDFLSDYTSGIYGKTHPYIHSAVSAALAKGIQFGAHTPHEAKLAAGLVQRFPSLELVRFANSGTEANLLAITTALKYTQRKKVVVFDGAYHGSLLCHFHAGEPEDVPGVLRPPFVCHFS